MKNRIPDESNDGTRMNFVPLLNGKYKLIIRHRVDFKDPKDLERYASGRAAHKKRITYFQTEIRILDEKITSPEYSLRTAYLWDRLMQLVHQMMNPDDYCYGTFEKQVFDLARAITSRM